MFLKNLNQLDLFYICICLSCNRTRFTDHMGKWVILWAATTLQIKMINLSSFIVS
jgi:hypothetical protein